MTECHCFMWIIAQVTSDLGQLQGSTFAHLVRARVVDSLALQAALTFVATPRGNALLQELKQMHQTQFPHAWQELQGLATGALLPFDTLFVLNLRQEFSAVVARASELAEDAVQHVGGAAADGEGCSDVLVSFKTPPTDSALLCQREAHQHVLSTGSNTQDYGACHGEGRNLVKEAQRAQQTQRAQHAQQTQQTQHAQHAQQAQQAQQDSAIGSLLGHNEDVGSDVVGRMYMVRAEMEGLPTWLALCYPGELASTAFGASSAGFAFTLDALYPQKLVLPGWGRNFLSRALLEIPHLASAMDLLTTPGQATGRSVNLLDLTNCGLKNIEVAPGGNVSVASIAEGEWMFHANAYQRMAVPMQESNSSAHREAVASHYGRPVSGADVLRLLGDDSDAKFPIYRRGDSPDTGISTMCTVLMECQAGRTTYASLMTGNPRLGHVMVKLDLHTLMPVENRPIQLDLD
eukprot:CAMPEP_0119116558 /NCGR_PEP_ID=MMETSP1180-20130426/52352_1 /TAXON_ID=3052 ORGANISM="Chlamydomonas cf sp, Strain CCMP681" /NCGR_SAMPLE_ID=MMETSP1180 /ASSEMBLY_ACC=CAM_ASM_000741 /LENGTH=460 /DNA_ID=CAMNT_0007105721 /DNA_START=113 /DNA_END=1494 /DNA_ORIENTATION=+